MCAIPPSHFRRPGPSPLCAFPAARPSPSHRCCSRRRGPHRRGERAIVPRSGATCWHFGAPEHLSARGRSGRPLLTVASPPPPPVHEVSVPGICRGTQSGERRGSCIGCKMAGAPLTWSCTWCLRFKLSPEEIEQRYKSQEIDRMLEKDKQTFRRQVKLLLLGAGESGKSTFLKQMRIIHGIKFEPELIKEYQHVIYQNIIKGMKVLVDARDKLNIPWEYPKNYDIGYQLLKFENTMILDTRLFLHYVPALQSLWKDASIRKAFDRRREFQLSDSVQYFLDNLDRIAKVDYIPTHQDILHCRKATKGISEFVIQINNIPFLFVDVGGQRSQRQKWYQCFDCVTSILFLVSSSEFDQVLLEDRRTNRLEESRNIFDTIINNMIFYGVSVILFLNKTDLLDKKVKSPDTNVRWYFPQFTGDSHSMKDVQNFILDLFVSVKRDPKKPLFHHFTTAVDTENIKVVFNAVKDTILHRNLESLMLQ